MQRLILLIFAWVLLCSSKSKDECIYQGDPQKARTDKITWYGIDVSHLRLVEGKRMDQKQRIAHEFCPAWIHRYETVFTLKKITKATRNKNIILGDEKFSLNRLDKLDTTELVSYKPRTFTVDTIQNIVNEYALPEKTGTGFVLIVGNLDKINERAENYMVFFDIESKKLLWVCKVYTNAGGKGLSKHWGSAINKSLDHFINEFYRNSINKESGFSNITQLGVMAGTSSGEIRNLPGKREGVVFAGGQTIFGGNINAHLFLGAGFGVYIGKQKYLFPGFLNLHYTVLNKKVTPIVSLSGGLSLGAGSNFSAGGGYFNGEVGLKVKISKGAAWKLSAGYTFQQLANSLSSDSKSFLFHMASAHTGFVF